MLLKIINNYELFFDMAIGVGAIQNWASLTN